jgi:hypothetical protein
MTTLKVGIASYEDMKARTMAVARGEHRIAPDEPKVWFTSTESFAKVLSAGNRDLLRVIVEQAPARSTNWRGSPARRSPTCRARCERWRAMAWSAWNAASAGGSRRR